MGSGYDDSAPGHRARAGCVRRTKKPRARRCASQVAGRSQLGAAAGMPVEGCEDGLRGGLEQPLDVDPWAHHALGCLDELTRDGDVGADDEDSASAPKNEAPNVEVVDERRKHVQEFRDQRGSKALAGGQSIVIVAIPSDTVGRRKAAVSPGCSGTRYLPRCAEVAVEKVRRRVTIDPSPGLRHE